MKSKVSSALAAAALVLSSGGIAVLTASPAEAANPKCMSRPEYRQIKVGMALSRVQAIVGSKGRVSMQSSFMSIRQWNTCGSAFGVATIGLMGGKVDNKSFIG
jgi:hypothetical protein